MSNFVGGVGDRHDEWLWILIIIAILIILLCCCNN
jgi:hypothetical protein